MEDIPRSDQAAEETEGAKAALVAKNCTLAEDAALTHLKRAVKLLRAATEKVRLHHPDGVHDMRVASRRLRAVLSDDRTVFSTSSLKSFRKRIHRITQSLGAARELDVCQEMLTAMRDGLPQNAVEAADWMAGQLASQREQEAATVADRAAGVESLGFKKALMQLFEHRIPTKVCYLERARERIQKRMDDVHEQYEDWQKSQSQESLHQLRVEFKKLRYTCELFGDVYGPDMEAFQRRLKQVQEALGRWNDWRVLHGYAVAAAPTASEEVQPSLETLQRTLDEGVREWSEKAEQEVAAFFAEETGEKFSTLIETYTIVCCREKEGTGALFELAE